MLCVPTSSGVDVGHRYEALVCHAVGLRVLLVNQAAGGPSLRDETHGSEGRGVSAWKIGGVPTIPLGWRSTTSVPCTLIYVFRRGALKK